MAVMGRPKKKRIFEVRICKCGCQRKFSVETTGQHPNQQFIHGHHNRVATFATRWNIGKAGRGKHPWNTGLTKETDNRVKSQSLKMGKYRPTEATLRKICKALHKKPNETEKKVTEIIKSVSKNYKYVGDGEVVIGGKIPDWINVNGQKKVIEFFNEYHHFRKIRDTKDPTYTKRKEQSKRQAHFRKYGFKCLVIWGSELQSIQRVQKRILQFNAC